MTRRYSTYKDSGVEWIGEIPEHWEVKKLKYISTVRVSSVDKHLFDDELPVTLCNYTDVYKNDFITSAKLESVGTCTSEEFRKFEITKADVLITKDSETPDDIGVPAIVSEELENTVCGYHVAILRPSPDLILGSFLFRQLQTKYARNYFEINSFGITRFGLGKSATEALFVIKPPIYEQSKIIEFLDAKTSLIDKLVDVKQRRIELLKEKRAALINNAVTKGLDPNVKMKDSGIEWIGEIPGHWVVSKLGLFTVKIGAGSTPTGGSEVYSDAGIPFIRSQNVLFSGLSLDGVVFIDPAIHDSMSGSKVLFEDVLLNITGGSIGRCCVVDSSIEMNVNQHVSIIRTDNRLDRYFLNYILQSELGQTQVRYNLTGGNREGLTIEGIRNFDITLPAKVEQLQIVSYLNSETKKIDDLVALEQKKIDLLKEYRQALISETVTGKIKVTND